MPITRIQCGDSTMLEFSSPPVNALGRELAEALARDIAQIGADPDTRAIVLAGAGTLFCAGADIGELGGDPGQAAAIRTLMQTLDASPVPVVAAIHGLAYGGGLELALACHARVAT
ncbi:MAG TPA: enoyl-CoA hydratase/isomerase family protein, partial [Chiayiivirga sp.]|nr:enoyl-CoA hydratase/isomerase family protein [Chiayiivirga sp.]